MKDEFGNFLENTYPKRAKGLIKKGRAEKVGEYEIRLAKGSAPPDTEDNMNTFNFTDNNNNESITVNAETGEVIENGVDMLHAAEPKQSKADNAKAAKTLFFNAREWKPNKDADKTVAVRSFITSPFGGLTESYMIGDWNWNWSTIETGELILEKNTDYEFVFWLNGGENDRNQETCHLKIIFDGDNENCYTYRLNRNFIKYERHYKGWYLYRIPFNTGDACYTKLRLEAMAAYVTYIRADVPEDYAGLPDDPAPVGLPQRHNIIFGEDGFPRNAWWSNKVFPEAGNGNQGGNQNSGFASEVSRGVDVGSIVGMISERIEEVLEEELDADEIAEEIAEEVMGNIDVESIKEEIIRNIKENLN